MKKIVVIGAGPAGLTAAYEILEKSKDYEVVVLEESGSFGGISRTVEHNGNRMDMGGHRFFSKVPAVNAWWDRLLPRQGSPARDDRLLGRRCTLAAGGPDPETEDRVMLRRHRISRIYFQKKFFDYPVSLKPQTIKNMGLLTTMLVGFSYLKSCVFKREEKSLEDFYINRFGKKLYSMFFEHYTENLWGRNPREISPEWGAQRVKGLSITAILKDIFGKLLHQKNRKVETSLIEEFSYPKLGPGQLWDITAKRILEMGARIEMNARAVGIKRIVDPEGARVTSVSYEKDGQIHEESADYVISSMPIKDLIAGMNDVPENVSYVAERLPYRDYMTVGVLVPRLNLKNETAFRTVGNIVPDDWVYVHDRSVKMGRFQVYNNWSPYMVKDLEHTVWVGLEYFCNEGDRLWKLSDERFAKGAIREMVRIKLIDSASDVLDYHVERVKKAYPAYFDTYDRIEEVREFLDSMPNLFCVGRNGQHRYNNIDHSMCTSFEAVKNILSGRTDKKNVWNVNTEQEYHEDE